MRRPKHGFWGANGLPQRVSGGAVLGGKQEWLVVRGEWLVASFAV